MYSHTILFQPPREADNVGRSLRMLERLRAGWRPGRALLATARRAERWTASRQADAMIYQFVGYCAGELSSSLVIGTLLAIEPQEGWAFLCDTTWITLGAGLPTLAPLDPNEEWTPAR